VSWDRDGDLSVGQDVSAGRDAYVAGRDLHIYRGQAAHGSAVEHEPRGRRRADLLLGAAYATRGRLIAGWVRRASRRSWPWLWLMTRQRGGGDAAGRPLPETGLAVLEGLAPRTKRGGKW
jgi:hypothetical protein